MMKKKVTILVSLSILVLLMFSFFTWFSIKNTETGIKLVKGQVILCSDGTPYGECSSTKPKYCDKGGFIGLFVNWLSKG